MENTTPNEDVQDDDAANAWVSNLVSETEAYGRPVFGVRKNTDDNTEAASGADGEGGGGKPDFDDEDEEAEKAEAKTVTIKGIKF